MIKNIPLELYQSPNFLELTQNHVRDLFIQVLADLRVPTTEELLICSGNIFDQARVWLKQNGYNVTTTKIEGFLQDKVEHTYLNHLIEELGIPEKNLPLESGKDRYFVLFRWVSEDFPRREKYVKSGFEKWTTKWSQIAKEDWMRLMVKQGAPKFSRNEDFNAEPGKISRTAKHSFHPKAKPLGRTHKTEYGEKRSFKKSAQKVKRPRTSETSPPRKYSSTDPNPRKKFF